MSDHEEYREERKVSYWVRLTLFFPFTLCLGLWEIGKSG